MNFSEFIGFIVTVLAMIYMGYQQVRSERAAPEEEVLKDDETQVKDLLRSLEIDVKNEEAVPRLPPRAPPKPKKVFTEMKDVVQAPRTSIIQVVTTSHYDSIDDAGDMLNLPSLIPLEYNLPTAPSIVKRITADTGVQKMIIIHELISKPKGLLP